VTADPSPRYVWKEYKPDGDGWGGATSYPPRVFYIFDTWYCWRTVYRFVCGRERMRAREARTRTRVLCAKWNLEHAAWLARG
jgi:hypothetical protein